MTEEKIEVERAIPGPTLAELLRKAYKEGKFKPVEEFFKKLREKFEEMMKKKKEGAGHYILESGVVSILPKKNEITIDAMAFGDKKVVAKLQNELGEMKDLRGRTILARIFFE